MSSPKSRTVQVIVFARRRAPALLIVALVPLATFGCAMRSETPKAAGIAAAKGRHLRAAECPRRADHKVRLVHPRAGRLRAVEWGLHG
jgi:hypothetical protein